MCEQENPPRNGEIATFFQHLFIVIAFEKCSVALFEIMHYLFTRNTYICNYTNFYSIAFYYKTEWLYSIVVFIKRSNVQFSNLYCFI